MLWEPVHFHVELTNVCTAKCPFCIRTKMGVKKHSELSIGDIKKFFDSELVEKLERVTLCGTWGDPIYTQDFLEIVEFFDSNNIKTTISTNGYYKKKFFWSRLGKTGAHVIFGIDGITQESHSRYRVGTQLKQILKNAKEFIDAGGDARWQFLVFGNNEHQILTAKKISQQLGFNEFVLRTSREYSRDLPEPKVKFESSGEKIGGKGFYCKYRHKKSYYISSSGQVLPCCYLADTEFKDTSLLDPKMNIRNATFSEIQQRGTWLKNIGKFFDEDGGNICHSNCPAKGIEKEKLIKN